MSNPTNETVSTPTSTQGRKKKFSIGDKVIFLRSDNFFIGTVIDVKLIQKHLSYTVRAEDGKEYSDLRVDNGLTYSIDSKKTLKKFGTTDEKDPDDTVE